MPALPPGRVREFREGPRETVRRLNEVVRGVNAGLASVAPPAQVRPEPVPGTATAVLLLYLLEEHGDYLECVSTAEVADVAAGLRPAARTYVAKPYLLRHSLAARTVQGDPQTYTVALDGATGVYERTATASDLSTETQVVVPGWTQGDQILALKAPGAGTGVSDAPGWLDLNVDARAWAKQA